MGVRPCEIYPSGKVGNISSLKEWQLEQNAAL